MLIGSNVEANWPKTLLDTITEKRMITIRKFCLTNFWGRFTVILYLENQFQIRKVIFQ